MRFFATALVLSLAAAPAPAAAFEPAGKGRLSAGPEDTNGAIEALVLRCRRDFVLAVVTPKRRLRPKRDPSEEEALFDTVFGRAIAFVDGVGYDLGVGGAGDNEEATVYLFAEEPQALLGALAGGERLTIRLDILPENAKGGAGFETFATFDIAGLGEALQDAGPACAVDPAGAEVR